MKLLFLTIFLSIQAAARPTDLSPILNNYFQIKDALVAGDAAAAATAAGEMLNAINVVDMKSMQAADHMVFMDLKDKLAFDARHISESKDISHQREHFISLSANMYKLASKVKLSGQPVYEDYCPMKKGYWLSSDTAIRNPYFGNSMLTCGKIAASIKP
jgi:hypothetical protein